MDVLEGQSCKKRGNDNDNWQEDVSVALDICFLEINCVLIILLFLIQSSFSWERRISQPFMLELTCRKGKVEGDGGNKDEFSSKENRFFAILLSFFFKCSTSLSGEE